MALHLLIYAKLKTEERQQFVVVRRFKLWFRFTVKRTFDVITKLFRYLIISPTAVPHASVEDTIVGFPVFITPKVFPIIYEVL